ncbi:MAG: hypothetical protein CM1200mP10_24590 [Candidatus Neomarinimicrobiota bacterium]|nr:MAG: hypothetical protein CM1200mP10_24590 [Candidatus Neomarinimicrobiota bacterium]
MTGKLYFSDGKTNGKHISVSMELDNGQHLKFLRIQENLVGFIITRHRIFKDKKLGIEPLGDSFPD